MEYWQSKNYYEILNVKRDASREEIRRAYRSLVKVNHPDLVTDPSLRRQREEFLKLLNAAYEILGDDIKRSEYDVKTTVGYTKTTYQSTGYTGTTYQSSTTYHYQEQPPRRKDREPPEVLIRGNEQLLRIEYVRRRFEMKHDLGFYIQKKIIQLYTTPDGYIYISLNDIGRARQYDADPKTARTGPVPVCAACGRTDATLRERYFVRNTGTFTNLRMRIRGGVLCSKCRAKEIRTAVLHNIFLGWWGFEAAAYNPGFIAINMLGGFRGKHTTKKMQEILRNYSLKQKKYEIYQELKGWRSKLDASLPSYLVDQMLYNSRHTFKAAAFTILTVVAIVWLMITLSGS